MRVLLTALLSVLVLSSFSFAMTKDAEYLRTTLSGMRPMELDSKTKDVKNLKDLSIRIGGDWGYFEFRGHKRPGIWNQHYSSIELDATLQGEGVIDVDRGVYVNSTTELTASPNLYAVYIGPWEEVVLKKKKELFKKQYEEKRVVRFFAYQEKEGGSIYFQYETQTSQNTKIKEKAFSLSPNSKTGPDRDSLSPVKWIANYGYHGVAEIKRIDGVRTMTGRVIDYRTGEAIGYYPPR